MRAELCMLAQNSASAVLLIALGGWLWTDVQRCRHLQRCLSCMSITCLRDFRDLFKALQVDQAMTATPAVNDCHPCVALSSVLMSGLCQL